MRGRRRSGAEGTRLLPGIVRRARTLAALPLAGVALFGTPAAAAPTSSAQGTPALIWRDVSRIAVQCVIVPRDGPRTLAVEAALCRSVVRQATAGAPARIGTIAIGDPALLAPGTVTLLVHASLAPAPGGRLLAFSIRPFRAATDQSSVLYGAAPRAALIPASAATSPALDAAVGAALSDLLPWRARPRGARAIDQN